MYLNFSTINVFVHGTKWHDILVDMSIDFKNLVMAMSGGSHAILASRWVTIYTIYVLLSPFELDELNKNQRNFFAEMLQATLAFGQLVQPKKRNPFQKYQMFKQKIIPRNIAVAKEKHHLKKPIQEIICFNFKNSFFFNKSPSPSQNFCCK